MILMVSPSPIAVISVLSILVGSISVSHSYFVSNACGSNGNYTSDSVYNINLYRALKRLYSTTNTSNSVFYNVSVGENLDMVNTLVLCRGDVEHNICRSCVNDTIRKLRELCPNQKEAVVWYDECMLRYSHNPVLNNLVTEPTKSLLKVNNASDMVQFDKGRRDLLDELREQAIERKFATANISGPDFGTIYGLMQCTPDLSVNDCHDCLDGLMSGISSAKIGGQLMNPSCRLRFETARFYNETTIVDAPPPMSELPPPPSSLPPPDKEDNTVRTVLIIVAGIVGFLILLLVILIYIYRRKRKQLTATRALSNDNVEDIRNVESLQYSFATIDVATNHFSDSNKLGQGGFGIVYKGILKSGQEVAVKRLSQGSGQGEQEFKNEVLLVAQLQHRNLARLLGFCYKRAERLLIYEFVPNASLDHFIFDSTKSSFLNWETRYKIIGGVARGLLYLHEDSRLRIIHRDLKPSNVLLDEDMNPKISDFGMARLCGINETQGNTSRVVGTYGYMAPEYAMYGEFSVKSDVFSFGVLILEIVSGQKTNCFRNGMNIEDLTSAVWKNWQEGNACNVIDPILKNSSESIQEIMRCIHIGLLCVQENVTKRPTMASVMHMLNSFSLTLALPSEPAFLMHSRIDTLESWSEDTFSSSMNDISSKAKDKSTDNSVNNASVSDVYPR